MELHTVVTTFLFSGLLSFNYISCEKNPNGSDMLKWTCICAANPLGALNSTTTYDCSTSCHCVPGDLDGVNWNCSCSATSSQATASINNPESCFSSCNCTFNSTEMPASQKRISDKTCLVIVLVLVVFTTIALSGSVAFYFYCKDRLSMQPRINSVKDSSYNSSANLISRGSASFLQSRYNNGSKLSYFKAFLLRISFMVKGEMQSVPGAIIRFSFSELAEATDKFSDANLIGQGGSSNVYQGRLKDGRIVAIKKLKMLGGIEADSSFPTEIEVISRLNHCHVLPLLGYCCEPQNWHCDRLLVFEYMSNGNLRECLDVKHGKEPLNWSIRIRVALGVARGLEYLHEAAAPRILHRDIKSTNILLDDNYKPKITDLGMAKCLTTDEHPSCSSSPARMLGTFGYFAPEYAIVGKASLKSDVFSFGVVILELITGRKPIHKSATADESLVLWAMPCLRDSKLVVTELPDPLLKGNFPEEDMQIMAHLARECLQWDPDSRPTMSEIVQILSTLSPERCHRKNFHANFQMSIRNTGLHFSSTKEEPDQLIPGRSKSSSAYRTLSHYSLPSTLDEILCEKNHVNQEPVISSDHIQQLIVLASSFHSQQSSEDEAVDIVEPSFELFL
ncbi:Receptor-like serine/threonine-protein kinase NCRK [Apostasia shenzhenica]|uniref:non-specific serine/threonine protein kinase n=1 Tax=Apostasia shenzhenica TaxID=1088818 RepID=A0A2H9ZWG5_9ASPA|nr:Receptor-like serine/threonine-protein kinase NCRK [Apostasia shenzhenica]